MRKDTEPNPKQGLLILALAVACVGFIVVVIVMVSDRGTNNIRTRSVEPTYGAPVPSAGESDASARKIPEPTQRCITQFQIMNNTGKYAPGRMTDDEYTRAVETLYSNPLLTRSQCAKVWDMLDK